MEDLSFNTQILTLTSHFSLQLWYNLFHFNTKGTQVFAYVLKLTLLFGVLLFSGCSDTQQNSDEGQSNPIIRPEVIPEKITLLLVSQQICPSCERLESTMQAPEIQTLIENYFDIQKIDFNEALPDNLPPPFGTPTVYFLGYNNELLIEPMIGEKSETQVLEFLNDALLEFSIVYGQALQDKETTP